MTELEKCMAGELYDCHDEYFIKAKARASAWCAKYNATPYTKRAVRRRAKRIITRVKPGGEVVVTVPPWRATLAEGAAFLASKWE